jgi:O-6-methylguanine DNA methyltransferase
LHPVSTRFLWYSNITNRIGCPNRIRDVDEARAANARAVAIPCHRVMKKDETLLGYRWVWVANAHTIENGGTHA